VLGVTEQKVQSVFGSWESIVNFHEKFHAKLEEVIREWEVNPCMVWRWGEKRKSGISLFFHISR
jgi:hypothetical protein